MLIAKKFEGIVETNKTEIETGKFQNLRSETKIETETEVFYKNIVYFQLVQKQ